MRTRERSSKPASSGRIRTSRGYTVTRRRCWWRTSYANTLITTRWTMPSLCICLRRPSSKPRTFKFLRARRTCWRGWTWRCLKKTSPCSCKWRSNWDHSNTKSNKCNHKSKSYSKPPKCSSRHSVTKTIPYRVRTPRRAATARRAHWCSSNSNYSNRKRRPSGTMTKFKLTTIYRRRLLTMLTNYNSSRLLWEPADHRNPVIH